MNITALINPLEISVEAKHLPLKFVTARNPLTVVRAILAFGTQEAGKSGVT